MRIFKYVILLMIGILIGGAIEKVHCFRAEFSAEVSSLREKLNIEAYLMRKLVEDCGIFEYENISYMHEINIKYFQTKISNITKFPHYGEKLIQVMFEEKHQKLTESHKAMTEQIEKCKST